MISQNVVISYVRELTLFITKYQKAGLKKLIQDGFVYDELKKKQVFFKCNAIDGYTITDKMKKQMAGLSVSQSMFLAARYFIANVFELREKLNLLSEDINIDDEIYFLYKMGIDAHVSVNIIEDTIDHALETVMEDSYKELAQELTIRSMMPTSKIRS